MLTLLTHLSLAPPFLRSILALLHFEFVAVIEVHDKRRVERRRKAAFTAINARRRVKQHWIINKLLSRYVHLQYRLAHATLLVEEAVMTRAMTSTLVHF
mmetsp:Transcript_48152/g.82190  ORF Transcript_48152/g.82190 Transcript_48152/m.82190 type:complete len:99 (+) Transcript_48152:1321-1617(+)